jgi:hypothetical protein
MAVSIKKKLQNARTYFVAAASVSKPIALLMLFFGLSFVVSVLIGLFLLGQWGYNRVVRVDQPIVVTTQPNTNPENGSNQEGNISNTGNSDTTKSEPTTDPNATPSSSTVTQPSQIATSVLPDTGASPVAYLVVALLGALSHSSYLRLRK